MAAMLTFLKMTRGAIGKELPEVIEKLQHS